MAIYIGRHDKLFHSITKPEMYIYEVLGFLLLEETHPPLVLSRLLLHQCSWVTLAVLRGHAMPEIKPKPPVFRAHTKYTTHLELSLQSIEKFKIKWLFSFLLLVHTWQCSGSNQCQESYSGLSKAKYVP